MKVAIAELLVVFLKVNISENVEFIELSFVILLNNCNLSVVITGLINPNALSQLELNEPVFILAPVIFLISPPEVSSTNKSVSLNVPPTAVCFDISKLIVLLLILVSTTLIASPLNIFSIPSPSKPFNDLVLPCSPFNDLFIYNI